MSEQDGRAPKWPILVLLAILVLEALVMVFVAGMLVVDVVTQPALSLASSIALVVLAVIGAIFVAAVAVGLWRGQAWARSGTIVWQVLQAAVAVVILQGDMADAAGWGLALGSLAALLLAFHPTVTLHLQRR